MRGMASEGCLFTRGPQSVRLVREDGSNGSLRLFVYGPGTEVVTHDFRDVAECMKRQAEIEAQLLAAGYQLTQSSSDRRVDHGTWSGSDHRRATR